MSRPRAVIRTIVKNLAIREDLAARMELELFSSAERRVPVGAQAQLVNTLLDKHFKELDARRTAGKNEEESE